MHRPASLGFHKHIEVGYYLCAPPFIAEKRDSGAGPKTRRLCSQTNTTTSVTGLGGRILWGTRKRPEGVRRPEFLVLAVWSWTSHMPSLSSTWHICTMNCLMPWALSSLLLACYEIGSSQESSLRFVLKCHFQNFNFFEPQILRLSNWEREMD